MQQRLAKRLEPLQVRMPSLYSLKLVLTISAVNLPTRGLEN
jgi:hypothetical protein